MSRPSDPVLHNVSNLFNGVDIPIHAACTSSQFRCDNGDCTSSSFRCNGVSGGCSDGSDERGCCKFGRTPVEQDC